MIYLNAGFSASIVANGYTGTLVATINEQSGTVSGTVFGEPIHGITAPNTHTIMFTRVGQTNSEDNQMYFGTFALNPPCTNGMGFPGATITGSFVVNSALNQTYPWTATIPNSCQEIH